MLQTLAVAVFSLGFVWSLSHTVAADSVEAARTAAHAAEAAKEGRGIPALSEVQAAAYLDGRAMWMASVAELNQYPGPHQVLELAEALELTEEQKRASSALYDETHEQAIRLGKQIVALEQKLNRLFAWGQASEEYVGQIVMEIGTLKARLRLSHLTAHLRERQLLSKEQVERYDELRGYGVTDETKGNRMGCNAAHHHGR